MNSEEHNQVLEVLRRRLQAWKVWRRGIRVLPRRSEEHGSTVLALQDVAQRIVVLEPRLAALALQGVAQRIAALSLQDWNGRVWRQVEINNYELGEWFNSWELPMRERDIQICHPFLYAMDLQHEQYLRYWSGKGGGHVWSRTSMLGGGSIKCSGIANFFNFEYFSCVANDATRGRKKRTVCEPVRDQYGQYWNAVTGELLIPGHLARTLAEANNHGSTILSGGGGNSHTLETSNGVLLHPLQCSSDRDSREGGGSQASVVDEGGGRFLIIDIEGMDVHTTQQRSNQDSVAAAHTTNLTETKLELPVVTPKVKTDARHSSEQSKYISDGPTSKKELSYPLCAGGDASAASMLVIDDVGVDVQNFVSAIFGGLVVLPLTNLSGTSKGDYPEFIRLGLYVGYVLLIVLTFLGLTSKKMAKHAIRVVAGMSIAAVTISAVYEISEKVYIKGIIGILGAMGTLAVAMIEWR